MKLLKQRKGVTLIELIVTLALTSIVLVAVFNLFLFNNRVFNRSDAVSHVQFDVRMASDMLTNELRNINAVSLTDNTMINEIALSEINSKYPSVISIDFIIGSESTRYLVKYTIVGADIHGENQYTLTSRVLLNNITSAIEGAGNTLYYD